jgi:hypothetical protein
LVVANDCAHRIVADELLTALSNEHELEGEAALEALVAL